VQVISTQLSIVGHSEQVVVLLESHISLSESHPVPSGQSQGSDKGASVAGTSVVTSGAPVIGTSVVMTGDSVAGTSVVGASVVGASVSGGSVAGNSVVVVTVLPPPAAVLT
jgi:hypothetical protein